MDVQTLIKLLADVKQNNQIFFEDSKKRLLGISSISSDVTNENHSVLLNLNYHSHKTLKAWELVVLLKQCPAAAIIWVQNQKKRQQIFGIRFAGVQVYLK
ncbi:hypothetical protein DS831_08625 [Bombilactobacillus bombi]|uniref:Uncharacterized protein n=1 Tax=Bombilactobacillus bombi TaxID=1303590 RepID=A0A347SS78_9LACO|nr:hypothetical protein [Bombilactobacillus bombi]AXX64887.1 hypothetical protein DS830_05100 [Bombilactobacillus bombi]MCO6541838.1 hypothetical protein [Lactobacillus sp.]RHW44295.1 hypothetical protein DS832_09140 [Bombilactobacillus bombi]RHW50209.1 hypothetical protein DS831_08625 [Bombilactobacillus bombi]